MVRMIMELVGNRSFTQGRLKNGVLQGVFHETPSLQHLHL